MQFAANNSWHHVGVQALACCRSLKAELQHSVRRLRTSDVRPRRRSGWSLIEACAAMFLGSTIFGIAVQLLFVTMHSVDSARDRVASAGAMARLAERFRSDIHAAREVVPEPVGKPARWIVKLSADERIEYENRDGALHWTKYRRDAVGGRDIFALPPGAELRLELEPKQNPSFASLLLNRGAEAAGESAERVLRIDARVGRDHRFLADSPKSEGK
jgi:hypothetical protein